MKKILIMIMLFVSVLSVGAFNIDGNIIEVGGIQDYTNSLTTQININNSYVNYSGNSQIINPTITENNVDFDWGGSIKKAGIFTSFSWVRYYSPVSQSVTAQIYLNGVVVGTKTLTCSSDTCTITLDENDYTTFLNVGSSFQILVSDTRQIWGAGTTQTFNNTYFNISGDGGTSFTYEELNKININSSLNYSINGASNVSICANCNTTDYNLTSSTQGIKNLTIYSENLLLPGIYETSYVIDTSNPSLNVTLPNTYNQFNNFDFSNYISYSDTNILSCIVIITGETTVNCDETSYTFTSAGNKTINITATDLAGNTNSSLSNIILIDPSQTIRFFDTTTATYVNNFYVDGVLYGANYSFNLSDYGVGTHNLNFTKEGIQNSSFNFTLTNTTQLNQVFNVSAISILMNVYDIDTLLPLTFDVLIQNSTDIITFTNQTVLSKEFDDLPHGDLKMTISVDGYSDGFYYNTLTATTSVIFNIYLTNESEASIITFSVKDYATKNELADVLIEARKVINDTIVTVQQTKTSDIGVAYLYLDGLTDFDFIFSKSGYTLAVVTSIPAVTSYSVNLQSSDTSYTYINDVSYKFTPSSSSLYLNQSISFSAFLLGTSITNSNLDIFDQNGNLLYNDTSINPTGTTFNFITTFLSADNVSKVVMNLSYLQDGTQHTFSREYSVFGELTNELKALDDLGNETGEDFKLFKLFAILVTFMVIIIATKRFMITRDYVSIILLFPITVFMFIGWIPYLYGTIMLITLIVMYMGGNKR